MFSVPLGILFGAPVSTCLLHFHSELSSLLTTRIAADNSGVHQEVREVAPLLVSVGHATDRVETLDYFCRSLIAAYLGNIVGALLVALPALYFFAPDYRAGGLRDAEAGEVINQDVNKRQDSPSTEVYEVDKRSQ